MSAQWYGGSANGRYITADSLGLRVLMGSHGHSPVPTGAHGYSRVLGTRTYLQPDHILHLLAVLAHLHPAALSGHSGSFVGWVRSAPFSGLPLPLQRCYSATVEPVNTLY